ncbi:LOW QUALITY PROTEIN: hypothetical protein, conserved [Eimeria necatrix]|uniref:Uncharacterized protein n=1 Tax=Eimeria necatrix TaxID=51315 RepID=U6N5Q3_9EIME|nr:LOW QUALITY PROTEIN: hypothetical protein, conserved [Eimeria necatrix]CDJ69250.1 hypothetical protein, conserved [Eimeria necatrix]
MEIAAAAWPHSWPRQEPLEGSQGTPSCSWGPPKKGPRGPPRAPPRGPRGAPAALICKPRGSALGLSSCLSLQGLFFSPISLGLSTACSQLQPIYDKCHGAPMSSEEPQETLGAPTRPEEPSGRSEEPQELPVNPRGPPAAWRGPQGPSGALKGPLGLWGASKGPERGLVTLEAPPGSIKSPRES